MVWQDPLSQAHPQPGRELYTASVLKPPEPTPPPRPRKDNRKDDSCSYLLCVCQPEPRVTNRYTEAQQGSVMCPRPPHGDGQDLNPDVPALVLSSDPSA